MTDDNTTGCTCSQKTPATSLTNPSFVFGDVNGILDFVTLATMDGIVPVGIEVRIVASINHTGGRHITSGGATPLILPVVGRAGVPIHQCDVFMSTTVNLRRGTLSKSG
ncbi:hypothetical protein E2C01_081275 [Portunus trituberculatus]|uniref:Uncharacterized protein n=1 Tax=Portunus trituberculatus TaxID=210409 RepID=A0A5B7IXI8_PORTR|nr:hypothetical protein [Portunus trituberculatus]